MLHVFEQSQLSVGPLCMDDGLERSGQLLHCYLQVRLHIKRRAERKVTCETGGLLTEKRKCIATNSCHIKNPNISQTDNEILH